MTTLYSTIKTRLSKIMGDTEDYSLASYYEGAINDTAREIYPVLHKPLKDHTLISGSALPNGHFDDWSQTTYPDLYRVSNVTAVEETTHIRGGTKSAKVTRADTDGHMYISEGQWVRLLDLMNTTVKFKCWVKATTVNQAYLEIYTKQADGTEQTEASSAHSGNGEFELLEKELALNDDLTDIQFRFKVITSNGDVYFDKARVTGKNLKEYLLPDDFQSGSLRQVKMQTIGDSDDLGLNGGFRLVWGWDIIHDSTYKYLIMPYVSSNKTIELIGDCPLEDDMDADADTMSIDDPEVNLFVAYAAYLLNERKRGTVSSDSVDRYEYESQRWLDKYNDLKGRLRMTRASAQLKPPTP